MPRGPRALSSPRWLLLASAAGALLVLATCKVNLGDDKVYSCATDADCAGGGFVCAPAGGYCCKPSGDEVCDGIDNDCDGRVDNRNVSETCNGEDDDCDGTVDNGFDLQSDSKNCGTCGHVCKAAELCAGGACELQKEADCSDGLDNDSNGKTDCLDPACDARSCGLSCVCGSLGKHEVACANGADDDGDMATDCADDDCLGKSCGAGCQCAAGGVKRETSCFDALDNDGDGKLDCGDTDCDGGACTQAPLFWTCSTGGCKCNGGAQVAEAGPVRCSDDVDNDCNGVKDCAETSCDMQPCNADGGCLCTSKKKKETACDNLLDDDGDGAADCADTDCPASTPCLKPDGGTGACSATKTCG
ncbi:MAG: hypothetical protein K1X89_06355 [Myxococcaceae bacterium]|nr:hypothetical protein [Myxococcaceae bacterium]